MRVRRAASFAGRKPSKKNRSVGRPLTVSAASTADAPGSAVTSRALLARRAHQLVAGVGDQRRAGIGDQRDGRAFGEPRQQLRPRLGGVVVVIGRQRGGDAVMVEQLAGHAGVLAGDQVGAGQHLERAQRDVAQIADRGGDQVEAGASGGAVDRLAMEDIAPGGPSRGGRAAEAAGAGLLMRCSLAARPPAVIGERKKSLSFSFS